MVACIFQLMNAMDYILIISCFFEFFVLGRGSVIYTEPGEKREPPPPKKKYASFFFNLTKYWFDESYMSFLTYTKALLVLTFVFHFIIEIIVFP